MVDDSRIAGSLSGLVICVVACNFRPDVSGMAPYNSLLVDALAEAGATVKVVTGVPHYPQWRVVDPQYRFGLSWRETPAAAANRGSVSVLRLRHAVPRTPDLIGRLRLEASFAMLSIPVVAAARADMVIGVTPVVGAAVAGMLSRRRRPFGAIVTDLAGNAAVQSGIASGRVAKIVAATEYRVLRRADRVGVITTKFNPALISGGVDADRIIEVPLFSHVGRTDLTPAAARRALGWPEDGRLTVVHTGNMGMKQGLEHVLDAARLANDRHAGAIDFVFVGDGSTRKFLEQQAAGLDNVRFLDLVPDEDYPVVLAAADVLLLHERPGVIEMALPSKLTSYTTASRPIVAAVASNSLTESLLSSRNAALVVPNGDPAALVDGLLRVRNDHALRARLVDAARVLGQEQFSERDGRHGFVGFAKALADSRPRR